jgi:hypothetical protein
MTVSYSNASIREVLLGVNVSRATAVLPTAVQSPQTIYTVTGGRILLVSLVGQVTTVIGGNAQTLKVSVQATVAGSSAVDLCSASASIATAAVGTHFTLPGVAADPLITDIANLSGVPFGAGRYLVDIGTITLTSSATNTGSVQWDLIYVPLDTGTVVAAA